MTQQDYEKAKAECWDAFWKENFKGCPVPPTMSIGEVFDYAFAKGYEVGKQATDAEEDEMLTVNRKQVQQMYAANERIKADFHGKETAHYSDHINHVLRHLFGSKCLPDDTCNVASNVASLEEKSTKPKFRVGDQVLYKDSEIVRVIDGTVGSDNYYIQGQCKCIPASDLKPYTESADLNTDCPTCTDVCSSKIDERRLNIAATIAAGMVVDWYHEPQGGSMNAKCRRLAEVSIIMADALIAECMTPTNNN